MGFAPPERIVVAADRRVRKRADYVLYWMIAARRPSVNFALDHALAHARALELPVQAIAGPAVAGTQGLEHQQR